MNNRRHVAVLLAIVSSLLSVMLALVVNIATGGRLPGSVAPYEWLAWPLLGLMTVATAGLAVWQHHLNQDASQPSPPPPPAREAPAPSELPAAAPLVGREDDLSALDELVTARAPVVVVSAAPGTGKSALALTYAHRVRARFPDGQLFVPLGGGGARSVTAQAALVGMLDALGHSGEERRGTVEQLSARFRSATADRRILVLLDDAADAAQVRPLLPGGTACLALVTSRRLIADLPGAAVLTLGPLTAAEALRLMAASAGESRIASDPSGAQRLVNACAGLPLAVRIVAARIRTRPEWTLTAFADRLEDESRRLEELRLGDRAVRSTFQATYDELTDLDRLVFRRAGAHPGDMFVLESAARRCGLDSPVVRETLDRLVDVFLVDAPTPQRYRLHDLLRLFAAEMLQHHETPGDRVACLARHLDWLRERASSRADLSGERDNILGVLRTAVADGLAEPAWALVEAVHPLLTAADDHIYRLPLWHAAERIAVALGDDLRRARALRWVSHSYGLAGQVALELRTAEQAFALAEECGEEWELAQTARRLGEALRASGRPADAEDRLEYALSLFERLGETREEIEVRIALGILHNTLGRPEASLDVLTRAADLLPATEEANHAWVLLGLGVAHKLSGRPVEAAELTARAFDLAEQLDDDYLRGYARQERGWLAAGEGRHGDAEGDFREMLDVFQRIRHGTGVASAYRALGVVLAAQRRRDEAADAVAAASAEDERLGHRPDPQATPRPSPR
ncbi:ATP-binding protein [Micromonospora sp. NPDC049497]|uniref:ATP-binding protein n=1 Tax=Micromonospora sp. NPDC049497 TaxID=3364273 RepID=UPI0037B32404